MDVNTMRAVLENMTSDMARDIHPYLCPQPSWPRVVAEGDIPPWCICNQCIQMDRERMNFCCGHNSCITLTPTFVDLCQRTSVVEIAGVYNYADENHESAMVQGNFLRNQAYRFFILWQYGKLGKGNRRCPPSCAVVRIRWKFPSLDQQYKGYESFQEEDFD
jgi:hypothetical protein